MKMKEYQNKWDADEEKMDLRCSVLRIWQPI